MKLIIAMIAVLLIAGVGYKQYQGMQRAEHMAELSAVDALHAKWGDARQIASSTGRIALAGPVKQMQDILRELESMPLVGCAQRVRAELTEGMTMELQGFLSFMQQAPDDISAWSFHEAKKSYESARSEARSCRDSLS